MRRRILLLALVAGILGFAAPVALEANSLPLFPGAFKSARVGTEQGAATVASAQATVNGRTFRVTGVLADAEQTVIAYHVTGRDGDGAYVMPVHGPRLVLDDGTVVNYRFIMASGRPDGKGSIVFPSLARGVHELTLDVDGLDIRRFPTDQAPARVNERFAVRLTVDNVTDYADSAKAAVMKQGGRGKGSFTVTEVSRTASLIVVRGTVDGLSREEIQSLGRPNISLVTADGARIASESGRLGFGDGYRQLEARFPAVPAGPVTLAVAGLSPNPADDALIDLVIP